MPSDSQNNARSTTANSILLVEEYDALAAALTSALQKFAPNQPVHVVPDLKAAEKACARAKPSLIIIDFEPSYPGLTEFLYKIRDVCPDSCALVLAAKVEKELAAEFRSLGTLHFTGKPYDISDLGAAVQALTGQTSSCATLSSLGVADVTLAQCVGGRDVVLTVREKKDKRGEIHIAGGQIVGASLGKYRDADALAEMFAWDEAQVRELQERPSGKRTIRGNWSDIFLEAARDVAVPRSKPAVEAAPAQVAAPPAKAVAPVQAVARAGKKIVVIDDTDMLLIFVEDVLSDADPGLQITTAPNGISGVKQVQQVMPDLVLLDYSLPDINGDEVCRRLLENEQTARVPIIMMSGHVLEMSVTAERFENVVATIPKPFLSEALTALVQQTLKEGTRPVRKIRKLAPVAAPAPIPVPVEPAPVPAPAPPPPPVRQAAPPAPEPTLARPMAPHFETPEPAPLTIPQSHPRQVAGPAILSAPARVKEANEVVLGLSLQVVSMQLTPSLRMGTIRAKPSSLVVSLHVSPAALRAAFPAETVFELGRVDLDPRGRISVMRLVPSLKAFQRMPTRNDLQIGALDVVPYDTSKHVQLTPSQNAPMMMHLLAHLEIAGVELSSTFQVAELICRNRSNTVRVTLNSDAGAPEQTGVFCETAAVKLDSSSRIAELLLKPLK